MRSGLSGWMHRTAEVLELLTFWKPEQQATHRFRIWRPPASSPLNFKKYKIQISFLPKRLPRPLKQPAKNFHDAYYLENTVFQNMLHSV